MPVFTAEVIGLQTYPSDDGISTDNVATLLLYQPYTQATKLLQDTADASPLSGLSTFGGFWTFVNGAFALLFGANVVYFAFGKLTALHLSSLAESIYSSGRRPLSALGLIHIFQKRTLIRRWHNEFPALHTEGGLPGSESAGIVAFIRERLINIDAGDEHNTEPQAVSLGNELNQEKGRISTETDERPRSTNESPVHPESWLEEISLLDSNLGSADVSRRRVRNEV